MTIEELLVEFVRYLKKEDSIQGTIDDEVLLHEYAREFLSNVESIETKNTFYNTSNPNASWSLPK